ncbi:xanthine dehydrogenase FAD-binding subunit XdhB [bacterium]|nr:xanthine dehydrogenase FAD-binding subunit XdhB [bacterium]
MFHIESYEKAESVAHAIELLKNNPQARPIAGGTDVLIRLREGKEGFRHLVDIHGLSDLKQCHILENGSLTIGSGVTFTEATLSDLIKQNIPILVTAASTVGGPQVRNVATFGGNICNGVTSADSASAFMVLNALLQLEGKEGIRQVPISEFYLGPGKVDRKQDEILTKFIITPENYKGYLGHYHKYAMRNAMDIATIGCAAACKIEDNVLKDIRLSYGVAGPVPIRCPQTEQAVKGQSVSLQLINDIKRMVEKDVNPRTSWRASKEFRLQIIRELAGRVVEKIIKDSGGRLN